MAKCIDCAKEVNGTYKRCYNCNNEFRKTSASSEKEEIDPSEGELFLQEYFDSEGISYRTEVPIMDLKDDPKSHRRADFYLSNYGVYVEFLGKWFVSESEKERYREKKRVYKENDIPCIFLYPENLGIVDFILPTRAIKEFKKHGLKKSLWLFRLKFLWLHKNENILLAIILLSVVLFGGFKWQEDSNLILIVVGIVLFQIYNTLSFYNKKLK